MLVITEMNRNDRSITEIFFLLGGLAGAFGGRLLGLEEHYRNISCFARNLGVCIGHLSGSLKERKSLNLFLLRSKL